ncbi:hypothetical protein LI328DRAFT_156577 [Trichoderma asperelloides]|nr:hypothetical protein LI328DRAFT_156577 [Trichoderma asperelloides]
MAREIVTVVGATGVQSGSIIDELLNAEKGFGRLAFEAPSNSTDMISIVLFNTNGALRAMEIESCQALNLAKAAAATPTLEHYIWSTLPDAKTQSSGKVLVPHFESKNIANRFILSQPEILAKTMFAILGAIIEQPRKTLPGKGKRQNILELEPSKFNKIWPSWAEEIGIMMQFFGWAKTARTQNNDLITRKDLGITSGLVDIKEAFSTMGF